MIRTATCFEYDEPSRSICVQAPGEDFVTWLVTFKSGETKQFKFPVHPVVESPVEAVTP